MKQTTDRRLEALEQKHKPPETQVIFVFGVSPKTHERVPVKSYRCRCGESFKLQPGESQDELESRASGHWEDHHTGIGLFVGNTKT